MFHDSLKSYNIVQMEVKGTTKKSKKVKEQSHNRSVFQKNSRGQKLIHLLSKLGLVSSKQGSQKKQAPPSIRSKEKCLLFHSRKVRKHYF